MLWKFQFVFIWGHEQCLVTLGQFTIGNYFCFKDLIHVYSACQGLPYGKEDQTLLIKDDWSKVFRNSKSIVFKKTVVAKVDWITFCKYSSNAFVDYHQVF